MKTRIYDWYVEHIEDRIFGPWGDHALQFVVTFVFLLGFVLLTKAIKGDLQTLGFLPG